MNNDLTYKALIQGGEREWLEFKTGVLFRPAVLIDKVSYFVNNTGGILIIGISDAGKPIGLKDDYRRFKELVEPQTYRFATYDLGENRDFHRRSLKSNLVLRWEFQPGSLLYVVWSQSRSASLDDVGESDLQLRPLRRLSDAFTDEGSNVFLAKVNFWLPL